MFQVWNVGSMFRRLQECRFLDKSVMFPEPEVSVDPRFMSAGQVEIS